MTTTRSENEKPRVSVKILIYAFSPFGHNHKNISQQVLLSIPDHSNLIKHVFPTQFSQAQFIKIVDEVNPDLIIGMGQYPRGKKLRIETVALNEWRSKSHPTITLINSVGEREIKVTHALHPTKETYPSINAGRYVCNYSMYIFGSWARSHNAKFAFLHIPKSYDLSTAVQFIEHELSNYHLQGN